MATRAAKDAAPSPSERQINLLRKREYDAMHRGGDPDDKQHPQGKLTAPEGIDLLVDPGATSKSMRSRAGRFPFGCCLSSGLPARCIASAFCLRWTLICRSQGCEI